MPIYAYKCAACGFEKDVIQKFSDAPLTHCPACAAEAFSKQLTAPAFQLKGSGWYVTDFRDNGQKKAAEKSSDDKASATSDGGEASNKSDASENKAKTESAAADKPASASSTDSSAASSAGSKTSPATTSTTSTSTATAT